MRVATLARVAAMGVVLLALAPACSGSRISGACADQPGYKTHVHPYLRIIVDGQDIRIPSNVGIKANCFQPVFTRDSSGILHIETNTEGDFTLGDFFSIWQAAPFPKVVVNGQTYPVSYTPTELMGRKVDADHVIRLVVDGKPSDEGQKLVLNRLSYCRSGGDQPECGDTARVDPAPPDLLKKYGAGHTIVLEYARK